MIHDCAILIVQGTFAPATVEKPLRYNPETKVNPVIQLQRFLYFQFIAILFLHVCFATFTFAEDRPEPELNLTEKIESLLKSKCEEDHLPSVSVAVVQNGATIFRGAQGMANLELNVPATVETVYQLQSVTKSFTATAIMMLIEEGKLSPDQLISEHFADTPESWREIKIIHLLQHTSGLKDYINDPTQSLRLEVTDEEVYQAAAKRSLNFQPGERYEYSNTNYHLLAMLIRKLTTKTYSEFLQERVFAPLKMDDTCVLSLSKLISQRAAGYEWTEEQFQNGPFYAESVLGYGGGGLMSNVVDLVKWNQGLDSGTILKPESLERMWTRGTLNDGTQSRYGFGWVIADVQEKRIVTHSGMHSTGFSTTFLKYPDDQVTVIVLVNRVGVNTEKIAISIGDLVFQHSK
ncbi:serine hydrolase domain-containing protein [Planctomicrobium sp. SH668]|uniref:serine hydrolase domain-containing protein n=1 Tax=Planctomicrobium sp. SH668 TaxID=3448126 RepID=UPI003F5C8B50